MKSSLGSAGVSLFIMPSMALCHARLAACGRLRRGSAISFAPPGVTSDGDELTWLPLPNFSAWCDSAWLSAISSSSDLIGASGPRSRSSR